MPHSYFYVDNTKYWYYGTYSDKDKAYQVARAIKQKYGGKYFVKGVDTFFGSYPKWHVYATKVRRLWS